jgi:nitroreductase
MKAIYSRRAVRDFAEGAVDEGQNDTLIQAAIQAPSAMNQQSWSFCVVSSAELLSHISSEAKAYLLRSTPAGLLSHHFGEMLASRDFDIFYHAPALILISAVEDSQWAQIDCALAAQNLMLAACDAGLGSCWIGFAQAWLATPDGKAALGLPAGYVPVAPIIVGHPKQQAAPVSRKAPEVRWLK